MMISTSTISSPSTSIDRNEVLKALVGDDITTAKDWIPRLLDINVMEISRRYHKYIDNKQILLSRNITINEKKEITNHVESIIVESLSKCPQFVIGKGRRLLSEKPIPAHLSLGLDAAQCKREADDDITKQHHLHPKQQGMPPHCVSSVRGVTYNLKAEAWVARWQRKGANVIKYFSVRLLGWDEAKRRAEVSRQMMEELGNVESVQLLKDIFGQLQGPPEDIPLLVQKLRCDDPRRYASIGETDRLLNIKHNQNGIRKTHTHSNQYTNESLACSNTHTHTHVNNCVNVQNPHTHTHTRTHTHTHIPMPIPLTASVSNSTHASHIQNESNNNIHAYPYTHTHTHTHTHG
eukprot:GHVR01010107.1.p1 GENE.GHVR01010107.1~~GHVR01010107.1.p1  ORF type:complete len:349 (+),score=145.68 GHVR01010107.1:65-1111(+)